MNEQTHAAIEHIVVDGGSNDGTVEVVHAESRRLTRMISEPDRGIYDAMNKGLQLATGELVGFLNADDILADRSTITNIARTATAHPLADAVYGDLVYVRRDRPESVLRHWRSGSFSRSRLRYGWMPPHPTFYVRTARLGELGGFSEALRIAADYDFMLRCLSRPGADAAYVPEVLVRMRAGGASNRSLPALIRKSREDLVALRRNEVGGWFSLACKNLRKLPQFLGGP